MNNPNTNCWYADNPNNFFFSFRASANRSSTALPLVCNSGFLLLDSGEGDPSFIYRCQDRYFAYNSMVGLRSIFFVLNDEHFDIYTQSIENLRQRLLESDAWNGVWGNLFLPEPCFLPCDIYRCEVPFTPLLERQMQRLEVRDSINATGLFCNQVSPTLSLLLGQWLQHIRDIVPSFIDFYKLALSGEIAIRFHDKLSYVKLLQAVPEDTLPLHAPTITLTIEELLDIRTWSDLSQRFIAATNDAISPTAFYIKSSFDSGGNAAAILTQKDYGEKYAAFKEELLGSLSLMDSSYCLAELRAAISAQQTWSAMTLPEETLAAYATAWTKKRSQQPLSIIVQRHIRRTAKPDTLLPYGIGYNLWIAPSGDCKVLAIAAQVYSDPEYKHHLGAWLSTDLANRIANLIPFAKVRNLASQFVLEGYCGPIGFDAILNESGEYEFIYDCNPRLTAVFPALAVRTFLIKQGFVVESVLNLDYRGRFQLADRQTMNKLSERGWLFEPNRPSGILYVPSLAKQDGFDVVMVNMSLEEMNAAVLSGLLGDGRDDDKGTITRLYC
ncbi:MAG: hypothetical protein F6J93_21880 [Oscillatoria sp. SIO1A7]|nr:hypothetical protein [Oscillatoria sp. SIO1A7]